MMEGFGLYNASEENYEVADFSFEKFKGSIEKILYKAGYGEAICLNFAHYSDSKKNNIWAYSSPGEGGCVIRYGNEKRNRNDGINEIECLHCTNKKGETQLVGAIFNFVGATGSLIQRTKDALKKNAKFSWFEK